LKLRAAMKNEPYVSKYFETFHLVRRSRPPSTCFGLHQWRAFNLSVVPQHSWETEPSADITRTTRALGHFGFLISHG
jgi:hypothetical protein